MRARESVAERALRRLIAATNKASQVRDAIAERTRIAAWEFGAKFGPLAIGDDDPSGPWYVAERMNRMKEKEDGANG